MKIKLLVILMALGLGASAQYVNVGANGVQRQIVAGDSTFRWNLGTAGFLYGKSLSWYRANFSPNLTFNNGLTRTANNVQLGGSYSSSIQIGNGTTQGSLYISPTTGFNGMSSAYGSFGVLPVAASFLYSGTSGGTVGMQFFRDSKALFIDSRFNKGLSYQTDYSTNWVLADSLALTPRSYVQRTFAPITGGSGYIQASPLTVQPAFISINNAVSASNFISVNQTYPSEFSEFIAVNAQTGIRTNQRNGFYFQGNLGTTIARFNDTNGGADEPNINLFEDVRFGKKLYLTTTPSTDATPTQILSLDAVTGGVKKVAYSGIATSDTTASSFRTKANSYTLAGLQAKLNITLATGQTIGANTTGNAATATTAINASTVTNGVYTTGSYTNPSWITTLDWSKIISTPTSLSGYGINDAVTTNTTQTGLSGNKTWTGQHFFNGGNIGIGTSSPTLGKLQIIQSANTASDGLTIQNAAATTSIRFWNDGTMARLSGGGTEGSSILLNGGGIGSIGINTITPTSTNGGLDIASGGIALILGADGAANTRTLNTNKIARIGSYTYGNTAMPFGIWNTNSTSTINQLNIGGGTGVMYASTEINFFTAATTTTTTGTSRGGFNSSGLFNLVNLTGSRAIVTDGSKNLVSSTTTSTEIGYVNGVTSSIQTQLDGKGTKARITASGTGIATTITYAHGLSGVTTSSWVSATANNAASAGISYVTVDATNVSIIYTVAPAAGTGNLIYSIEVRP